MSLGYVGNLRYCLEELKRQKYEIEREIMIIEEQLQQCDREYQNDRYYQKWGVPFEEHHDYSP